MFNALIHVCSDGLVQSFEPVPPLGALQYQSCFFPPVLLEVGVLLLVHAQRANELFHVSTKHARGEESGPLTARGANGEAPPLTAVFMKCSVEPQMKAGLGRCDSR